MEYAGLNELVLLISFQSSGCSFLCSTILGLQVLLGHFESVTCCAVYATPRALNSNGNSNAVPSSSYALVLSGSLDETLKVVNGVKGWLSF